MSRLNDLKIQNKFENYLNDRNVNNLTNNLQNNLSNNLPINNTTYNIKNPTDIFVFGHSHYVNKKNISNISTYYNCGEWINNSFYLESNGERYELKEFKSP